MITKAYREAFRTDGIRILQVTDFNIGMPDIRKNMIGSVASYGADFLFAEKEVHSSVGSWNDFSEIAFKDNKGNTLTTEGIIMYESKFDIIEFLSKRICVDSSSMLSKFVAKSINRKGVPDKKRLASMLFIEFRDYSLNYEEVEGLPLVSLEDFSTFGMVNCETKSGNVIAPKYSGYKNGPVFVAEKKINVSGHDVPRSCFVFLFCGSVYGEEMTIAFDGDKYLMRSKYEDVDRSLLEYLDREGNIYRNMVGIDIFANNHMTARCIMKIPAKKELESCLSKKKTKKFLSGNKLPSYLQNPCYVLDSRNPISVSSDTYVVDSPEEALLLLSRTTRGIFTPRRIFNELITPTLPDKESFVILAEPGRL